MSLDALIAALQQNSAQIESERRNNQAQLLQYAAQEQYSNPAAAPRPHGRGRQGKNKYSGKNVNFVKSPFSNLMVPVKGVHVTSNYGPRVNPITHRQSNHTGVDFGAGLGTPIRAAANGFVKQANKNDTIYGNQLVLGHGHGFQTMYGHMDHFNVKPGQKVHKGQVIGYVGSTGWSTGPHLHFETWRHGNPMNPMKFL